MLSPIDRRAPELEALLEEGVHEGVFPGAVAAIGTLDAQHGSARRIAWAGRTAPGEPEVTADTPYDLASLTKPLVATAALRLCQHGHVDLHEPVAALLPALDGTHGGEATLADLLAHRAGLAAWAPLYAAITSPRASPEARASMLEAAARTVGDAPRARRASVYSDLGYLIAGEALARAAGSALDALVRLEVTAPLGLDPAIAYAAALPEAAREALARVVAPTEACALRGRVVRGEVHDENAYAFGGIAGHAGLFGTATAVLGFGLSVLLALEGRSRWLDQALLRWALSPRGPGYVIGWDTRSPEGSSAGSRFSLQSFGHLGFTGTSLWCDPTRRLCAVLLSNRVHPTRENTLIRGFRPRFHDLVAALCDAGALRDPV